MSSPFRSALAIVAVVLFAHSAALACTVPVFRYALDRWTPDSFVLEVPQEIAAGSEGLILGELLRLEGANMVIQAADVPAGKARLLTPGKGGVEVWSGEFDTDAILGLGKSPGGTKVADAILAGETAAWVLVPGTDKKKNAAFEKTLRDRLAFLGKVAEIPEQDPTDPENKLSPGPELRVGFKVIKVGRDDPAERLTVKCLAGKDGDALLESPEPFAAAVFGRGRVLGAWDSDVLDEEGIDEISLFLLGACSCRVKAENPGWDMLMAVDWDTRMMQAAMDADKAKEEKKAAAETTAPAETAPEAATGETLQSGTEKK